MPDAATSERDDVEEVARRLAAHEGGLGEAAGESPRRFASSPAAVAGGTVAGGAVVGEQRLPRAAEGASGGSGSSRMPVRSVIAAVTVAIC